MNQINTHYDARFFLKKSEIDAEIEWMCPPTENGLLSFPSKEGT